MFFNRIVNVFLIPFIIFSSFLVFSNGVNGNEKLDNVNIVETVGFEKDDDGKWVMTDRESQMVIEWNEEIDTIQVSLPKKGPGLVVSDGFEAVVIEITNEEVIYNINRTDSTLQELRLTLVAVQDETELPRMNEIKAVENTVQLFSTDSSNKELTIRGRGFGHRVGMSQWGAQGLANRGVGYQSILSHYYPGTSLTARYNDSETVTVNLNNGNGKESWSLHVPNGADVTGATTQVDRLTGKNRFETAVSVSKIGWNQSNIVVLTRGDNFADALAGVSLAHKHGAPILLTESNQLREETKAEIVRLGATKVIILGGEQAISKEVVSDIKKIGNIDIERIAGKSRLDTAREVAKKVAPNGSQTVVIVNGFDFPDALSIAPYAAEQGIPILLTNKSQLDNETKSLIVSLGATKTIVVGGTLVIEQNAVKDLPGLTRIAGANRYDTNVQVQNYFNNTNKHFYVATGTGFVDALTGSALAAKEGKGIVLSQKESLSEPIKNYLSHKEIHKFTVLGGTIAIDDAVKTELSNTAIKTLEPNVEYEVTSSGFQPADPNKTKIETNVHNATIKPKNNGFTDVQFGSDRRKYYGLLDLQVSNQNILLKNRVSFHNYLMGVVPHEAYPSWNVEALKSQAVAARTYAAGKSLNVVDSQLNQVYKGIYENSTYAKNILNSVSGTEGRVLTDSNGKLISALYSSSNGGMIESNRGAWGSSLVSYLTAREDIYNLNGTNIVPEENAISSGGSYVPPGTYAWERKINYSVIEQQWSTIGELQTVEIISRTEGQGAAEIKLTGTKGTVTVTGNEFRSKLGTMTILSTYIFVD
ncbi:cell wall-binding repeat-containing protein [Alkalihalobacillus sp. BA299]|uniref:cell wall-binding repeat-containing protein n=1 Tax=Alkalihalobacillus sp. BA299 TaxID=2815938 RepID=UPI001ADCD9DB|nr:cell wall-binding repeat-containing protein [Alkalihalobacillus sp. BA299]